jgi:hypothetical protein
MKPSEAAVILAKIAAYDRRTVGEADAQAWAEALDGHVTVADALQAVTDHFTESRDWIMPVDVIKRAAKFRRARIQAAGLPDFPSDLTAAEERKWLEIWHAHLSRGDTPLAAQYSADLVLNVTRVPSQPVEPEKLRAMLDQLGTSWRFPPKFDDDVVDAELEA